ncbi:hypothetical protein Tco_0058847 [Tanacetum coccineum]
MSAKQPDSQHKHQNWKKLEKDLKILNADVRETKSYSQHGGGALVERVGRVGRPYGHYSFAHNNTNGNHNGFSGGGQQRGQTYADASYGLPTLEKESISREYNVAKVRVVVSGSLLLCGHL